MHPAQKSAGFPWSGLPLPLARLAHEVVSQSASLLILAELIRISGSQPTLLVDASLEWRGRSELQSHFPVYIFIYLFFYVPFQDLAKDTSLLFMR